ncbi:DUF3775 domain-containing protein [Roseibium limicola]|uniref:DUF3775 domain-containing protein n=1 Tax=Roseibium limicola TaxID=2816037 RepID=A0A939J720_9HYPH|nr:DUF3775 domain-containing protein [Roseibium limicola]MBO0343791.1 DUF3775 domain-containing protein [Roseibium limicola]
MDITLTLSADSIRFMIEKIRMAASSIDDSYEDGHEGEVEFDAETLTGAHHHEGLAEEENDDMSDAEARELIGDLNVDEASELIAIVWVGRGDYEAEDFAQAVLDAQEHRQANRKHKTADYLLGMPLLADHLEAGLDSLDL